MLLLLSQGCKRPKNIEDPTGLYTLSAESIKSEIEAGNLDYNYISSTGSAFVKSDAVSVSGTFTLRIKKDEAAWLRVQKFGFEAVRILIKNDSITVLNRLNKTYSKWSMDEASKITNLKLTQNEAIDLLAGHSLLESSEFISIEQDSLSYKYKTAFDEFFATYSYDALDKLVFAAKFVDLENRIMTTNYSEFQMLDETQSFGYNRIYELSGSSLGDAMLELKFKDVTLNEEITFPFEIPQHYTRVE